MRPPSSTQMCLDETSKQLLEHTRVPVPARPGAVARVDDEDKRCGTANIFAAVEPLTGGCLLQATDHRTTSTWLTSSGVSAKSLRECHRHRPRHGHPQHAHALVPYPAFPPAEARRLTERLEVRYTPKHGSWRNMAEILLASLARQCLDQRIRSVARLRAILSAWRDARTTGRVK
jgi:hypothetical protein